MEDYQTYINELTDSRLKVQQECLEEAILHNYQYQNYVVDNLKHFKNQFSKIEDSEIKVLDNIFLLGNYSRMITSLLKDLEKNEQEKKTLEQKKLIMIQELNKRGKL
tara:strand:- start:773 stop:1093 length:321 start_codon:yes stop_codon:yes gene_type:complete